MPLTRAIALKEQAAGKTQAATARKWHVSRQYVSRLLNAEPATRGRGRPVTTQGCGTCGGTGRVALAGND